MNRSASPERTTILSPANAAAAAAALSKAIAYAELMQEENGAWSRLRGEFPYESEPTSWAVGVLAGRAGEEERVKRGLAFMLNDQRLDGSWNGNSAHTSFAIVALTKALSGVQQGAEATSKALDYLRSVQQENGGFARLGREGQPLVVYTANVLFALAAAGIGRDEAIVDKGLRWLRSCQNADGGFGMTEGSDSVALATTWTMRAFQAFSGDAVASAIKRAWDWLLMVQHASGGFSMTAAVPEDPEVTSLAICALRPLPKMEKTLERAVAYLVGAQHPDGSFTSSMPMQFNNVAKKNTQTTLFVIWALSEVVEA